MPVWGPVEAEAPEDHHMLVQGAGREAFISQVTSCWSNGGTIVLAHRMDQPKDNPPVPLSIIIARLWIRET